MRDLEPFVWKLVIMVARCDVCGKEALCIYVPEFDRRHCGECVDAVRRLLETCG